MGDAEQKWECESAKLYFDLSVEGDNGFYLNNKNELIMFTVKAATQFRTGLFTILVDQDVLPLRGADYLRTLDKYLIEGEFSRSGKQYAKMKFTSYSNDPLDFLSVSKIPGWLEDLVD